MQDKINLIKNTQLFSSLSLKEAEIFATYSDIIHFKDDETIFEEGSPGDSLYIVNYGEVRIIKMTGEDKVLDIAKFISGEIFGELDLFENTPRSATAVAEQDTGLLIFPKKGEKFTDIINKHPDIFAHILHDLITIIARRIRDANKLVSEKAKWIEELRGQLLYDKLTGVYNRLYLTEEFSTVLKQQDNTSMLFIKPDNFKYINDTFGHTAGDRALLEIANTVKSNLNENDTLVRYGGDEFIAILPHTGPEALDRAEQIRAAMYNIDITNLTGGEAFRFGTSIGISAFPDDAKDPAQLVEIAFDKMMKVRNSGGNRVLK